MRANTGWSQREREVLDLIARGRTNAEIAEALGISFWTAKWHVAELISKLGVSSREEVAAYWRREQQPIAGARRFARRVAALPLLAKAAAGIAAAGLAAGALVAALVIAGVGGDGEPPAEPASTTATPTSATTTATPTPDITAVPGALTWPETKRTGEPAVDAVIDAVISGDAARLQALLQLVPVRCDASSPPTVMPGCPEPITRPSYPSSGCEDLWRADFSLLPWETQLRQLPRLYAVYRRLPVAANPPSELPRGEFVVVFAFTQTNPGYGWALHVTGGRVVLEQGACGPFPQDLFGDARPSDFLLLPPAGLPLPTPTAVRRTTGDAATGRLIDAIVAGDWRTLAAAFVLYPEPCTTATERGVGSPPPCPPGVADGGTVMTTRISHCETVRSTDAASTLEEIFKNEYRWGHEVYAAFRNPPAEYLGGVPGGDLAVVVRRQNRTEAWEWHLAGGRVVGLRMGCDDQAADYLKGVAPADLVLPPLP